MKFGSGSINVLLPAWHALAVNSSIAIKNMALIENISLKKTLFPVGQASIVDENGYLTNDVINQIHEINLSLRKKKENLSDLTRISKHTWGSWLRKRRRPANSGLTVLALLVTQPEFVLNTLQSVRSSCANDSQ